MGTHISDQATWQMFAGGAKIMSEIRSFDSPVSPLCLCCKLIDWCFQLTKRTLDVIFYDTATRNGERCAQKGF